MSILTEARTYREDIPLFQRLGLKLFKFDDKEEHYLGEYKLPNYEDAKVKISVECWPAQFWRFEIISSEGEKYKLSTGSGTLSRYWESILLFAEGMIVIKN